MPESIAYITKIKGTSPAAPLSLMFWICIIDMR